MGTQQLPRPLSTAARKNRGGPGQARMWSLAPAKERIRVLHGERKTVLMVATKNGVPVAVALSLADVEWLRQALVSPFAQQEGGAG